MPADRRPHLRERLRGRERGAPGAAVHADREDPRDPGARGGGDEVRVVGLARVEVGVAVDHSLGNSGSSLATRAPPVPAPKRAASSSSPGRPSAASSRSVVAGMYG
jgi:hypothetical protein